MRSVFSFLDPSSIEVVIHNGAAKFCGLQLSPFQSKNISSSALEWWKKWEFLKRDRHLKEFAIFLGQDKELDSSDIELDQTTSDSLNEITSTFFEIISSSVDKYSLTRQLRKLLRFTCIFHRSLYEKRWITGENKHTSHFVEIFVNFIKKHIYIKYLNVSSFHRDERTLGWLKHVHKLIITHQELARGDRRETDPQRRPQGYVYHFFDTESIDSYIGKAFEGDAGRTPAKRFFSEHVRQIMSPRKKAENWIPCYDIMRKRGIWNVVHLTLCTIPDTTKERLHHHEQYFIHTFQASLNTPFINHRNKENLHIGEKKVNRKSTLHTLRKYHPERKDAFANAKMIPKQSTIAHDMAYKLGEAKRRFEKYAKKIVRYPIHVQKRILHIINTQLYGRARAIALWRLKNTVNLPIKTHVKLQIPYIKNSPLKMNIAKHLRKVIHGPVVVVIDEKLPPTISDTLQNQKRWNTQLDHTHPCTCNTLHEKFGFKISDAGHVCTTYSSLGIIPPFTSVQSRVIPSVPTVEAHLKHHFSAFHRRNPDLFGRFSNELFCQPIGLWVDEFAESWHEYSSCPKQQTLRDWSHAVGTEAVITRQIDKNRHDLCISCPAFYFDRMRKMFLDNPQYKIITRNEALQFENNLQEGLAKMQIRGLRPKPPWPHQWGTASIFHKKSGILTKDRPLVSYFFHLGKEIFSAFGRAGVWFIQQVVRDHICVFSAQKVTENFNSFSSQIQFDQNDRSTNELHTNAFKFDIDNFFPSIPKVLLRQSWQWILAKAGNDYGKQGIARYSYIHIPLQYKGGGKIENEFFMKFEEFCQKRTYKGKLRRIYKEKPKPFFSNRRTPEKGFISVKISDIVTATFLDLDNAVVLFGSTYLLQLDGSPQGSPMSMSNATAVAVYLEARHWQAVFGRINEILNTEYIRVLRQRWVDDLFLIIVTNRSLSHHDRTQIHRIIETIYHPFKLKIEDESVFVGFRPILSNGQIKFTIDTRSAPEMLTSGRPCFVSAQSNINARQIEGTITGAILRCLDCSSDSEICTLALRSTLTELCLLKFAPKLFIRCLYKLEKRYEIMREFISAFTSL